MGHKCFVSYKKEDLSYKKKLVDLFDSKDIIDKTLDRIIDSADGDYIMQTIRDDYLSDSTVTIFLIGAHSSENEGVDYWGRAKNYFIQRELQASLYNGKNNTRNGILGVVIPEMYSEIFKGSYTCTICNKSHGYVSVGDKTVIREFGKNYYCEPHSGCSWSEDERYCLLVKWEDFIDNPSEYIDQAFEKRNSEVSAKIRIRDLRQLQRIFCEYSNTYQFVVT